MIVGDSPDDVGYAYYGAMGAAHTIANEPPATDDAVQALRRTVEEITGKPLEEPPPRRIGFY